MKTGRILFHDVLIWSEGLFIIASTIIFMFNITSYWVPATLGLIFICAVIVYLITAGFDDALFFYKIFF
jgi:hypothetical protein